MAPCLVLGSFAFRHFWTITAVIPGQAFLFFMITPYKNILAMTGIQCSAFPWMDSEAWSGCFLHRHGWRGQHPGWADFISLWAFSQVRREWDQQQEGHGSEGCEIQWIRQKIHIKNGSLGLVFLKNTAFSVCNGGVLFPEQWNCTTEIMPSPRHCIPEDPVGSRVLDLAEHKTAEGVQCFLKMYWQAPKCTASPCMDIPCQTDMLTVTCSPVFLLNRCTKCVHLHSCFQSLQTVVLPWATSAQGKCLLQISLLLPRCFRVGV